MEGSNQVTGLKGSLLKRMRLLIQRVSEAWVEVEGQTTGSIGPGLLVFVGVSRTDVEADADYLAAKLAGLRIFHDSGGKMNLSVQQAGGGILLVSQFTLYGDCRRGRRPSFDAAAPPERAQALYNYFVETVRKGPVPVETGVFQADMRVYLVNNGPVTLLLDSAERSAK
jgi:D-aminoacyl-tRNA deacylase